MIRSRAEKAGGESTGYIYSVLVVIPNSTPVWVDVGSPGHSSGSALLIKSDPNDPTRAISVDDGVGTSLEAVVSVVVVAILLVLVLIGVGWVTGRRRRKA